MAITSRPTITAPATYLAPRDAQVVTEENVQPTTSPLDPFFLLSNLAANPGSVPGFVESRVPGLTKAIFEQETFLGNFLDLISRPTFEPADDIDLVSRLKEEGLWADEELRNRFIGVQSAAEFNYTLAKVRKREQDLRTIASSGPLGMVYGIGVGMVTDPTIFIPLTAGGRGLLGLAQGIGLGAAAGALTEGTIYANQPGMRAEEAFAGIALNTVLGGVLGGAVAFLPTGAGPKALQQFTDELVAGSRQEIFIAPKPMGIGAAARDDALVDAGRLARPYFGLGTVFDTIANVSPVTRSLNQQVSSRLRAIQANLGTGGLRLERNLEGVPSAPGGTIESLIGQYDRVYARGLQTVDELYNNYALGNVKPRGAVRGLQASIASKTSAQIMSRDDFGREVSRALFSGDQHAIKEVAEAAAQIRTQVLEPMLARAQAVEAAHPGTFPHLTPEAIDAAKLRGEDTSYAHRILDDEAIRRRPVEFEKLLAEDFAARLEREFQERLAKLDGLETADREAIDLMSMDFQAAAALRQQILKDLKELDDVRMDKPDLVRLQDIEDELDFWRESARDRDLPLAARNEAKANVDRLNELGGADFAARKAVRAKLRKTLRTLNKNVTLLADKRAAKLQLIENLEGQSISALNRVARAGARTQKALDGVSDKAIDSAISELKTAFAQTLGRFDRAETRIKALSEDASDADFSLFMKMEELENRQTTTFEKLNALSEKLEDAEGLDRSTLRADIDEVLQEVIGAVQEANRRRSVRQAKLGDQVAQLDPEVQRARVLAKEEGILDRRAQFIEQTQEAGGAKVRLATKEARLLPEQSGADFYAYAMKAAQEARLKIEGNYTRVPAFELIGGNRGGELLRAINMDTNKLIDAGFVDTDINRMLSSYVNTLGPDIEIAKRFGRLAHNPGEGRLEEGTIWNQLAEEQAEIQTRRHAELVASGAKPEKIEKEMKKLSRVYEHGVRDISAQINRLRHTRGNAANPRSGLMRMGQGISDVNTLRFMGGVTVSSVPDLGRPVMKFGMQRALRAGLSPFIGGLKELKLSKAAMQSAGVGLDSTIAQMSRTFNGAISDMNRATKVENGLRWASMHMGQIALFDQWTVGMKTLATHAYMGELSDDLRRLMTGKSDKHLLARLAEVGIDAPRAEAIWREMTTTPGGGELSNGIWFPNTETWTDPDAIESLNAAITWKVNSTIVTPGLERPLILDANPIAKMIFQFKSFIGSSTTMTLMAGMQNTGMAGAVNTVVGSATMIALGMVSWYLSASLLGGEAQEKMLTADAGKWVDEGLDRSGLLGLLSLAPQLGANFAFGDYLTFGDDEQLTRTGGRGLFEDALGPSASLARPLTAAVELATAGIQSAIPGTSEEDAQPTQSSIRALRQLIPFQNIFFLRSAFDSIEKIVAANFPESREQARTSTEGLK